METGSVNNINEGMLSFLKENNKESDELWALGCDGTVVSSGVHGGVLRLVKN